MFLVLLFVLFLFLALVVLAQHLAGRCDYVLRCSYSVMPSSRWFLLLYTLPSRQDTARVAVWRKFKKIGAIQIKTSPSLLPDQPAQYEHFQWLAQQIRDYGGDATLVRAQEIEGMPNEKLVALFNRARDQEFGEVEKALQAFLAHRKKN